MLNQVMDDDEITNDHEDGLEFSEESEDESSSQYIEYNPNQFNPYTNFFTRSHPLKTKTTNPPYYETLPQQNHRNYKKYQTVSFYQTHQRIRQRHIRHHRRPRPGRKIPRQTLRNTPRHRSTASGHRH